MRTIAKRSLVGLAMLATVMTSSLAATGPAQAYVDHQLSWETIRIDTGTCSPTHPIYVGYGSRDDYCYVGGTHFTEDTGGIALRVQIFLNGDRVAKFEFHPYGEIFKVCDTENDDDGLHGVLQYKLGGGWFSTPLVSAPGTSKAIECTRKNYSFAEGTEMKLVVYDDKAKTDHVGSIWLFRA